MNGTSGTFNTVERVALLVVLALVVALIARRLRFPYTLALVLVGLALGVFHVLPDLQLQPEIVLFLFLPALLFEGAWSLHVEALLADWLPILLLAVPGLLLSLGVIALVIHWGTSLPLLVALLLATIVSPTDPVAVIGLLRQLGMPTRLRTIIEGESLFNDGVGAAAYILTLGFLLITLHQGGNLVGLSPLAVVAKALWLFLGGPLLGLGIGLLVSRLVRHVDDYLIEATMTLGVAYGSYLIGDSLGTSGLLAVVFAGLIMGSYGRRVGMSQRTRYAVDDIWEFIGYIANSLLFLVVGHEIGNSSLIGALPTIVWAVIAVLASRVIMIYLLLPLQDWLARRISKPKAPGMVPRHLHPAPLPHLWRPLIVLSGLRGALSLALALSLPTNIPQYRLLQLTVFGVVLVTLVGQGVGLRFLLPRWPTAEKNTSVPTDSEQALEG